MKQAYQILVIFILLLCSSCSSKTQRNIDYIQDIIPDLNVQMNSSPELIVQPKDFLSIIVSTKNVELVSSFNLSNKAFEAGSPSNEITSSARGVLGYSVSVDGTIDFPYLGKIKIAGLTRKEVENTIRDELIDRGLLIDPIITVEFLNFKISLLGEVARPGQYTLPNEKITIFQGLSMAGDMTIFGRRDNVMVIRESYGKREIFVLDLTSRDVFNSPGYYLQQEDIVYVCPNDVRAGQSTINENYLRSGGFIMSMSSLAIVLTNLLIKVL